MLRPQTLPKDPIEELPASVLVASELEADEVITGATATARSYGTGLDSTAALCDGAALWTATAVAQRLRAGLRGERHQVTWIYTTSLGRVLTAHVDVVIR